MKKLTLQILTLLIFIIFGYIKIYSNEAIFNISGVDATEFPRVKAAFIANDASGKPYKNLSPADFNVLENGQSMNSTVSVKCIDTIVDPAVSIILVVDQSYSMTTTNDSGQTRWSWVLEGATSFIKAINFASGTKVALISFGRVAYLRCNFSNNKQELIDSLNNIQVAGGTLYDPPILDTLRGAVRLFQTGSPDLNKRRIIVFLTDGDPNDPPKVDSMLSNRLGTGLLQNNIQFYAITLAMPMHPSLNRLSKETGGAAYAVYTRRELNDIYSFIALDIQRTQLCHLSWLAPFGCTDVSKFRNIKITFKRLNVTVDRSYTAPANSIAYVYTSESIISFNDPPPNNSVNKTVTLTARESDFKVTALYTQPPTYFQVIDGNVPFTIPKDSSVTITIRFTQGSTRSFRQATLIAEGSPCPPIVSLVGGISQIQIIHPNKGEIFSTCDTIEIKWAGIEPDKPVNLSFSTDQGTTWQLIKNNVTGLKYKWLPPKEGNQFLIKGVVSPVSSYMWLKGAGGVSDDAITSLAIQDDNRFFYVTGFYDNNATFDNKTVNSNGVKDIFLAKYDLDGNLFGVVSAGGFGQDSATGVCVDPLNNAYITGTCFQTAQFGNINPNMPIADAPYCFIAKYPENLTSPLVVLIGPDNIHTGFKAWGLKIRYVSKNPDPRNQDPLNPDEIYVQGLYTGSFQSVSGWSLPRRTTPTKFTALLKSDLTIRSVQLGGTDYPDYSSTTDFDSDGNRYESGRFTGNTSAGTFTITSKGKTDGFIRKFGGTPGSQDICDTVFAVQSPKLSFKQNPVDFNLCTIGERVYKVYEDFLCNTGTIPVEIISSAITGSNTSDFIIGSRLNSLWLQPGQCIPIELVFEAKDIGARTAQLEIVGTCNTRVALTLKGIGVCSGEVVKKVDMGQINVNTMRDSVITCVFRNTNTNYVDIKPKIKGPNASDFSCDGSTVFLAPNECKDLKISFTPSAPGERIAYLHYDLPPGCEDPVTELSGFGVDADIALSSCDWEGKRILTVNDSFIVLTNNSFLAQNITNIELETADGSIFKLGTLKPFPIRVASKDTMHIPVTFNPSEELIYNNTILVSVQSLPNKLRAPIRGQGILPKIQTNWICDTPVKPGETSIAKLEITNPSKTADLYVESVTFTYNTGDFKWVGAPPTNFYVPMEQTITFDIIFSPQSSGTRVELIKVRCDAAPGPNKFPLRDTSVDAQCDGLGLRTANVIDFKTNLVCSQNVKKLRISNESWQTPITVIDYYFIGADSTAFKVDLPIDFTINPGNFRELEIKFNPTEKKSYSTRLVLKTTIDLDLNIELKGVGDFILFYTETKTIKAIPGTLLKMPLKVKIAQLDNPLVNKLKAEIRFNTEMILDEKAVEFANIPGLTPATPIHQKGLIVLEWNGSLTTPVDVELCKVNLRVYLSQFKDTPVMFKALMDTCATEDNVGATIELEKICFLDGRLIVFSNTQYSLSQPEPNPSNSNSLIEFGVGLDGQTNIVIYNSIGQLVKTIMDDNLKSGNYKINIDLSDLSSGVYYIIMKSGPFIETKQLVISK